MKFNILDIKSFFKNFFFLNAIQILNVLFYIVIYKFSIKVLGDEKYGYFIFVTSIVTYLNLFVNFGIEIPTMREYQKIKGDKEKESFELSKSVCTKLFLTILIYIILLVISLLEKDGKINLLMIISVQILGTVFNVSWLMQLENKLDKLFYFQLLTKIVTLLILYRVIESQNSFHAYSLIIASHFIIFNLISFIYALKVFKLRFFIVGINSVYQNIKDSLVFFISNSLGIIRLNSINLLVGHYVGFTQVSYIDLANKFIAFPQSLISNINNALLPLVLKKKIINRFGLLKLVVIELILSILILLLLYGILPILISYFTTEHSILVFNISMILSLSIVSYLMVGSLINIVFIPLEKDWLIYTNQLVSIIAFLLVFFLGISNHANSIFISFSISMSAIIEIIFCLIASFYYVKK